MDECSDDLLIGFIREGNEEAYRLLTSKYEKIVLKWINEKKKLLYVNKIEVEDIFYSIMAKFDSLLEEYDNHLGYFALYLKICVERFIIKSVREQNSHGKKALTSAVSLDKNVNDSSDLTYVESIDSNYLINEVENRYDISSKADKIKKIMSSLTHEERKILFLKYEEKSYKEISQIMEINEKRVDYVLSKIRKKLTNC